MMPEGMEQHGMILKETFPNGSQGFECPICGRRFIIQWPPHYKRVILNEGDPNAAHSASTCALGGMELNMSSAQILKDTHSEDRHDNEMPGDWLPVGLPEEDYGLPYEGNDPYLEVFSDWVTAHL